jgi:hypothetical protein
MGATANGYPWPEPTAPVRDGAAAVRALAEHDQRQTPWAMRAGWGGGNTDVSGYVRVIFTDLFVSGIVANLWNLGIGLDWRICVAAMEGYGSGGQISAVVMQVLQANGAPAANTAVGFYYIAYGTPG